MILGAHKNDSSGRSQITIFRGGFKQLSLWLWSSFGIVPGLVKDIFSRIIAWHASIHVLRPHIYPPLSSLITVSPARVWCRVRGWTSRYDLSTVIIPFYQFSLLFLCFHYEQVQLTMWALYSLNCLEIRSKWIAKVVLHNKDQNCT